MTLTIHPDTVPLRVDDWGNVCVGSSNVLFEFLIERFEDGMSPECLTHAYDTLKLADVYAVIAYYLRHQDEVKAYMVERRKEFEELRKEVESRYPPRLGFREELLARKARMEKQDAASGHR
jgi:uncharacterized protein (DUF433 family)